MLQGKTPYMYSHSGVGTGKILLLGDCPVMKQHLICTGGEGKVGIVVAAQYHRN